jgi:hypothetical protein
MTRLLAAGLALLALAAWLRRPHVPPPPSRPFPLNGQHTDFRDPYLDSLREVRR